MFFTASQTKPVSGLARKSARILCLGATLVSICISTAFAADIAAITPNTHSASAAGTARTTATTVQQPDANAISANTTAVSAAGSARSAEQVNTAAQAQQENEQEEKEAAAKAAAQALEAQKAAEAARLSANTYAPIYGGVVSYNASAAVPASVLQNGTSLGNYKLTFYCPCAKCCGAWADGKTKTGATATEGRTIAVDTNKIPLGSRIHIVGFGDFIAEDIGSAIQGNKIDIFLNSHSRCYELGIKNAAVYLIK